MNTVEYPSDELAKSGHLPLTEREVFDAYNGDFIGRLLKIADDLTREGTDDSECQAKDIHRRANEIIDVLKDHLLRTMLVQDNVDV
jgi:hypothetical protein